MIAFAYIALFITPLVAVTVIAGARGSARSVAGVLVFGWLFLPLLGVKIAEGIPVYDKNVAVTLGMLVGMLVARPDAYLKLRPKWVDLAMATWCLAPIASSLSNGLGFYDGLSAAFRQIAVWGGPYLVGRLVFTDAASMMELARMLAIGGAVYFPFCLIESRMAPQIHWWIYGMSGRANWETADFFGPLRFKPSVFLQANLELTPLMGAAALCGWWLWRTGRPRQLFRNAPSGWTVAAAWMATILGKSLGGISLAVGGAGVLLLSQRSRRTLFMAALLAVAPTYIITRSAGVWSGAQFVQFLKDYVSQRRAESFETRLVNEDQLVEKAMERPVFGWGGWGRNRISTEDGRDVSLTDGMWVVAFGSHGMVGLVAFYTVLLLPGAMVVRRIGPALWTDPRLAGIAAMAVVVTLHAIDCIPNAMPNPIYYAAAGGLTAVAAGLSPLAARRGVTYVRQSRRVRSVVRTPAGQARPFESKQSIA